MHVGWQTLITGNMAITQNSPLPKEHTCVPSYALTLVPYTGVAARSPMLAHRRLAVVNVIFAVGTGQARSAQAGVAINVILASAAGSTGTGHAVISIIGTCIT